MVDSFGADLPRDKLSQGGRALYALSEVRKLRAIRKGKPRSSFDGREPDSVIGLRTTIRHPVGDAPVDLRKAIEATVVAAGKREHPPGGTLPPDVEALILMVAHDPHGVTDTHIDALRDSWSEEAIYEIVVTAAAASALVRIELAWTALGTA